MTPKVSSQFPNIVGVEKVENNALNSSMELNPFWTGFTAGEPKILGKIHKINKRDAITIMSIIF
jgi:hypothetical protein